MDSAPYKMLYSDKYDLYTEQYKTTFCFQLNLFESNLGKGRLVAKNILKNYIEYTYPSRILFRRLFQYFIGFCFVG